ncbi:hypothetical protein [Brytella acorum]|uniref:hypothetical protein n=1 Tax=Brytella acorum TaxID=2959299 RepID=UPI0025AE7A8A|nr:hypothetical protein [Brytella acorum]MDF3625776.1 hypothetical protein [Brytella acorum]
MRKIGPYSRPEALLKMDGRTRYARVLKKVRADLIAHVGGKPSPTQLALIERAAWITLHMTLMDGHMLQGGAPAERDARQYLAWSNTHARIMRALGLESAAASPETLSAYISERAA